MGDFSLFGLKNKRILIKTYLFESGLFYLGKSLGKALSSDNEIFFIRKESYRKAGRFYEPYYKSLNDPNLLDGLNVLNSNLFENSIIDHVKNREIDIVISLETFMKKSKWVEEISRISNCVVYDVPMPEWTDLKAIRFGAYRKFDKILCLTKTSADIFSGYEKSTKTEWDYANYISDNLPETYVHRDKFTFYHQASLNNTFSQKNTESVILAFINFSKKYNDCKLLVTGILSESESILSKKSNNIMIINEVLSKEDIIKLYLKSGCLLAPSTREGLGLQFFEAKRLGAQIITTDVDPMREYSNYLCKVISYNGGGSIVRHAITSPEEIEKQLIKYYEDVSDE